MEYDPRDPTDPLLPMLSARLSLSVALGLAVLLGAAQAEPAAASGRVVGLKISLTDVDLDTFTVDFDLTQYTDAPFPMGTAAGLLGNLLYTDFNALTATLLDPVIPALEYGDGGVVTQATLPLAGSGTYRGSFRHTYPDFGLYTLRAGAASFQLGYSETVSYDNPLLPFATGRPVTATHVAYAVYSPFTRGRTTFSFDADQPYVMGITNTAEVRLFLPPPAPGQAPVTDIPSASEPGLGLLALVLGAAALVALRR